MLWTFFLHLSLGLLPKSFFFVLFPIFPPPPWLWCTMCAAINLPTALPVIYNGSIFSHSKFGKQQGQRGGAICPSWFSFCEARGWVTPRHSNSHPPVSCNRTCCVAHFGADVARFDIRERYCCFACCGWSTNIACVICQHVQKRSRGLFNLAKSQCTRWIFHLHPLRTIFGVFCQKCTYLHIH